MKDHYISDTTQPHDMSENPDISDTLGSSKNLDTFDAVDCVDSINSGNASVDSGNASGEVVEAETDSVFGVDVNMDMNMDVNMDVKPGLKMESKMSGLSTLDQFMPIVLFLGFYQIAKSTELAILFATAWSVKSVITRRRKGLAVGWWIPCVTVYLMVRGAISIAVDREWLEFLGLNISSEAAYFGISMGTKALIGLAIIGSILVRKPCALWLVDKMFNLPDRIKKDARFIRSLRNITWVIAAYQLLSTVWDFWLFNNSSTGIFVIIRLAASYGSIFVLTLASLIYFDRSLSSIPGWPGLAGLINPELDQNGAQTELQPASDAGHRASDATTYE